MSRLRNIQRKGDERACRVARAVANATGVCLLCVTPVLAQVTRVSSLEAYEPGQSGVLVVDWEGGASADGILVSLPASWTIVGSHVYTSKFGLDEIPIESRRSVSEAVVGTDMLRDDCTLLIEFVAGQIGGNEIARVAPVLKLDQGWSELPSQAVVKPASTVRHSRPADAGDNHVGSFAKRGEVRIRPGRLPWLSTDVSHGVSLWVRTTSTDEVILSDWTGREIDRYNVELIVTGDGSLAYYRGQQGRHESMKSPEPIADGRWHHVAVSHDAVMGWTRLFVDGAVVDSLKQQSSGSTGTRPPVVVGNRVVSGDDAVIDFKKGARFTGFLDDVSFWASALNAAAIRSHRTANAATSAPRFNLDFEPETTLGGVDIEPHTIARHDPVSDLRVSVSGTTVELGWVSFDPMTRAYVVDRSFDGDRFTEVGRVSPDRSFGGRFVFTDTPIEGEVVYYRVRQLFVNGGSKTSGTVKSGLADVMESGLDQPTLIVSNFPNPFRQSTSVRYEIPNEGPVEVSVWDLSGQPVITLVDNVQAAGAYETLFSAGDLSAGTYFVRIQQGSQIKSHKLLLVK